MTPVVEVEGLVVRLGSAPRPVVDGVTFQLRSSERVALLGPSGCGKTSTLRALAGFERAAAGRVFTPDRVLSGPGVHVSPHERAMGMVFQDFALFPHLTVGENVSFGLKERSGSRRAKVNAWLSKVELAGMHERMPDQLSGGQQQRVALARALAPGPRVVLLDEPFSGLDASLRASTRQHTERVLESAAATALLVTHDQEEAMAFAQRLLVMREGRIEQEGTPEQLYREPRNAFVAQFLGEANLIEGEAEGQSARTAWGVITLGSSAQGRVLLCARPEAFALGAEGARRVIIVARTYRGASCLFKVRGDGFEGAVLAPSDAPWRIGDTAGVSSVGRARVLEHSSCLPHGSATS